MNTHINDDFNEILRATNLTSEKNNFFISAAKKKNISINSAYLIAWNWREITKNFLFTTLKGIGTMAEKINKRQNPSAEVIIVLQTAISIIADDLYSVNPIFNQLSNDFDANKAHYKWWERTILNPIEQVISNKISKEKIIGNDVKKLIKKMEEYSHISVGAAIQLRIVEDIARDICIAFKSIFSQVENNGEKVYKSEKELSWIFSHIQAEEIHQQRVSYHFYNTLDKIDPDISRAMILDLTNEYCCSWNNALLNLENYLES